MAVYYGGIVLTEKDRIKYLLPCKPGNKHSPKATDGTIGLVGFYSALRNIPGISIHFSFSYHSTLNHILEVLRT